MDSEEERIPMNAEQQGGNSVSSDGQETCVGTSSSTSALLSSGSTPDSPERQMEICERALNGTYFNLENYREVLSISIQLAHRYYRSTMMITLEALSDFQLSLYAQAQFNNAHIESLIPQSQNSHFEKFNVLCFREAFPKDFRFNSSRNSI